MGQRKTADLIDLALDWAVAECLGATRIQLYQYNGRGFLRVYLDGGIHAPWEPSRYWAQGGPIIDRDKIGVRHIGHSIDGELWDASINDEEIEGPTALIAAMRCFVASRLGDEVEVPDELVQ